jgi:hypothetical protein
VLEFLLALVPSAGVLLLFWWVVKGLVEADRRERLAQARLESEGRPRGGAPEGAPAAPDRSRPPA